MSAIPFVVIVVALIAVVLGAIWHALDRWREAYHRLHAQRAELRKDCQALQAQEAKLRKDCQALGAEYAEYLTAQRLRSSKKPLLSRRGVSQQEFDDRLSELGFKSLGEYQQSDHWREVRWRYRKSDYPQRCLVCGARNFDLHHRSYARLGAELLFDLVPLCQKHHGELHELLDSDPELCIKDTHDYLPLLVDKQRGGSRREGQGNWHTEKIAEYKERFRSLSTEDIRYRLNKMLDVLQQEEAIALQELLNERELGDDMANPVEPPAPSG